MWHALRGSYELGVSKGEAQANAAVQKRKIESMKSPIFYKKQYSRQQRDLASKPFKKKVGKTCYYCP
jgi:hypothetical protein